MSGNDAAMTGANDMDTTVFPTSDEMVNQLLQPPVTTPSAAAATLAAKTICVALKRGRFGNSKRASLAQATFDADENNRRPDKALLSLSKQLLDSPELSAIDKLDSAVSRDLRVRAFSSMFKGGVFLVSVGQVEEVEVLLKENQERRKALVDLAVAAYPIRTEETSARLGVVHDPADYPSVERFRASFYFDWSWITFETPTRLKAISAALFKNEAAKAAARLSAVAEECQQAMRAGLAKLVDHLAERLTPDPEGKKKKLSDSTIGHLNDFLTTFELRNVTDDSELGAIVARARDVMVGIDHKTLKSDELIAQSVQAKLTEIKAALEPLIVDKGTRSISLDDDGDV